jgi:hypothetical protein
LFLLREFVKFEDPSLHLASNVNSSADLHFLFLLCHAILTTGVVKHAVDSAGTGGVGLGFMTL